MRRNWYIIVLGYLMLFFVGFCIGKIASAQEPTGSATLTWTPPTQNEDGTAYTDYGGFKIYYRRAGILEWNNTIDLPDTTNTLNTYVVNTLPYGNYEFAMTAYNASGTESRFSNIATKVVGAIPQPPDPTFVTVNTVVYDLVKKDDGFVFVAVGNIALNTPCDISQSVMGKNVVPVASVTSWLGSVRPKVVLAECSN